MEQRGKRDENGQLVLSNEERTNFERQFRINLEGGEWGIILDSQKWKQLDKAVVGVVRSILQKGIVGNKQMLRRSMGESGVMLVRRSDKTEKELLSDTQLFDLSESIRALDSALPKEGLGYGPEFDSLVKKVSQIFLKPNVEFDEEETERRTIQAKSAVEPIYFKIMRGETILRAGDLITETQVRKLNRLRELQGSKNVVRTSIGYVVLTAIVLLCSLYVCSFDLAKIKALNSRSYSSGTYTGRQFLFY